MVASSPWWRRRGSSRTALDRVELALAGADRCPDRLLDGRRGRDLGRLGVFLAGHRGLELAHALPERAPHLRQLLRPEDEEHDEEENQQLRHSNPTWHAGHPSTLVRRPCKAARLRGRQRLLDVGRLARAVRLAGALQLQTGLLDELAVVERA